MSDTSVIKPWKRERINRELKYLIRWGKKLYQPTILAKRGSKRDVLEAIASVPKLVKRKKMVLNDAADMVHYGMRYGVLSKIEAALAFDKVIQNPHFVSAQRDYLRRLKELCFARPSGGYISQLEPETLRIRGEDGKVREIESPKLTETDLDLTHPDNSGLLAHLEITPPATSQHIPKFMEKVEENLRNKDPGLAAVLLTAAARIHLRSGDSKSMREVDKIIRRLRSKVFIKTRFADNYGHFCAVGLVDHILGRMGISGRFDRETPN